MFPNVRLLIGALFASIIALSCGFGVFAAFRVNHDPLSRLPADTAALQLVADEPAQPRPIWGVPVNARSVAVQSVEALIDAPHPVRPAALEPPKSSASQPANADMTAPTPKAKVSQPTQPRVAAAPVAPTAQTSAPALHAVAMTPVPAVAPVATANAPAQQTPAAGLQSVSPTPAVKKNATATIKAASVETGTAQTAAKKAEPTEPAIAPAATREPSAEPSQSAASSAASADITGSVTETAVIEAPPIPIARPKLRTRIARKPVERRHIVLRQHVVHEARVRPATQWGGQNSTYSDPVFQSAPNFQQPAAQPRGGRTTKPSVAGDSPAWPSAQ